jgi:hypothetical protein
VSNRQPHAFFDLEAIDRAEWLARFCDDPRPAGSAFEVPFPRLRRDETPHSWLIDQFRRWGRQPGLRDRVRKSVVRLITSKALPHDLAHPSQAVGELLQVASACGFLDIAEPLKGWIRGDVSFEPLASRGIDLETTYNIAAQKITLRRIVWSLLIGWHCAGDLRDYLERDLTQLLENARRLSEDLTLAVPKGRDLARQGGDCALLLFRELGRLDPAAAITRIPSLLRWPRAYWRDAFGQFVTDLTPRVLITATYHDAWGRCFGEILYDSALQPLIATSPRTGQSGSLARVFFDHGIEIRLRRDAIELRCGDGSANGLDIDMEARRVDASRGLAVWINRWFNVDAPLDGLAMQEV